MGILMSKKIIPEPPPKRNMIRKESSVYLYAAWSLIMMATTAIALMILYKLDM